MVLMLIMSERVTRVGAHDNGFFLTLVWYPAVGICLRFWSIRILMDIGLFP